MSSIPSQRHLFDVPHDVAYFNCAYNSPQLNASRDRLLSGVVEKSHPWNRTSADFFRDAETIRRLSAEALGGDADGYAVIPAASYGLSTAARAVEPRLQRGDGIVLMAEEFPSNVLPWRRVAKERGAVLHTIDTPAANDWTQAVLNRIDRSTKVVALSTCHWTNGAQLDLRPIGQACREAGCVLVVDASQTLGAVPFPFDDVQPDFLVAAGYKWLLCPYGFSLLHVSERWRDARPLEETWLARKNAEDFTALVRYSDTYLPGARRFDVGQKCTATILPGAIAALEQIKAWNVEKIAASLFVTNTRIADRLEQLGFELIDEKNRSPHILGVRNSSAGDVVAQLRDRNIYISQRGDALRFSPHLHCTDYDINRLLDAVDELAERQSRH